MNFLKTSLRYITRDKTFSFINIFGLAAGLMAVLCIALYVLRESNYDRFHKDADRIYRFSAAMLIEGIERETHEFVPPVGPAMKAEIPEIEEYTRISSQQSFIAAFEDKSFKLNEVCYADTAFFDMFTFPLLRGNAQTALTVPFSIVLCEETADKFFGNMDPMGQLIRLGTNDFTVTGIVKSPPVNSHIKFNALLSFSTLYRLPNTHLGWNGGNQYSTYVRLHTNANIESVRGKTQNVISENIGNSMAERGMQLTGKLYPLLDVYLHHNFPVSMFIRIGVIVLSVFAFIILAIACINFVNLNTARSMRRIKEASVRKVLGAKRNGLVKQFLGESLMLSVAAFILSLLIFIFIQQLYVQLAGALPDTDLIVAALFIVLALTVITGFIGGSYPAIRLSSIDLSDASKGGGKVKRNKHKFQSALIITQFTSSVFLIICTIATSQQLSYMRNMDLGFEKEGVLVLDFNGDRAADRAEILKHQLQILPEISSITATSSMMGSGFARNGYIPQGMENPVIINVVDVDKDFLETFDIQIKAGRFFSGDEQDKNYYVVNETLAKTFGWNDEAIGKTISRDGEHEIIGVVSDFNYASLYRKLEPLIITNAPNNDCFKLASIKYRTSATPAFLSKVKNIWNDVNPDVPFDYSFLDESYDKQYELETNFRSLFATFAGIAIILASLGVLSLMAYTTEQRKKEIGIRKVLGASVKEILVLLLKRTIIQVLVANIIAWPLAWFIVHEGLQIFAYQISIGPLIFITAFVLSALAALLAAGFQAFKAAMANPVDTIKTE